MRRPLPLPALLLPAVLLLALVLAAPAAHAHGIIVVGDDVVIVRPGPTPTPPVRVNPVRLKGHRVEARVVGRVADVTVEQVFHNDSDRQLEGTYLFPLPEGASVSRFAMTMGGKMVEGEIMEASKARQIYEDIVRRRRDPGLLEYLGRGLFRARVFPILPRQDLTIRLAFQQLLPEDDGTLELRYPLATDRVSGAPVDDVVLTVDVESDVDLKAIYSPSHDVAVVRKDDRHAQVSYERSGARQDRDFLLYVGRSPDDVGFSLLSHKGAGEDGTFMAVLAPSTTVPEDRWVPKDVVYVLDTSGSMAQDDKIGQARKALEHGVRVLRPGDRFNIVSFAGQVRPFRDGLVDVTPETKEAATRWIADLRAAGGTNIEGALRDALAMGGQDRLFLVVFITDGRPTIGEREPEALVRMVQAGNPSQARVFTFGVGFDLDVRLLDRIAEATKASRDYVMPQEDLEVVTSRFFRKVSEPVMTDVRLELGSGVHDVYPSTLPDLFAGGQVVVLGRYGETGDRVIRLHGKLAGREVVHEYEATFADGERAAFLPRLWAHRKVAFLLDEIRLHGEDEELVREVVALATRYGIVTPYTAGLVVEETEMLDMPADGVADARTRAGRFREGLVRRLEGRADGADAGPRGTPPPPSAPVPGLGVGGGGGHAAPGAAAGPAPAAEPATSAGERLARDSEELRRLKDALSGETDEDDGYAGLRERVRTAEDKTFLLASSGRWVDTAWDGFKEPTKVEAFSEAYFDLLTKSPKVAKYLALGEAVLFVLGDEVYEVVPGEAR